MRAEEPPSEPWPPREVPAAPAPNVDVARALAEHGRFLRSLHATTPRAAATGALIAINLGVFALMLARGVDLVKPNGLDLVAWGANYGPRNFQGEHWRLFTSMFLHFGIVHIGFNMWVLKSVGPFLERMLGHSGFLALYLVAGLFASAVAVWWNPGAISAGASGAIFGVVGGLIGAIAARPPEIPASFAAQLKKSLLTFVAMNLALGLALPQIGLAAHVGGLVAGFAGGFALAKGGLSLGRPRRGRELAWVAGGVAIVALVTILPPRNYAPHSAARDGLITTFEAAASSYDAELERLREGEIDQARFADVIERELLPPWRVARERLDAVREVPADDAREISVLREFAARQEHAWTLLVESIRTGDASLATDAMSERQRAEELLAEYARARRD